MIRHRTRVPDQMRTRWLASLISVVAAALSHGADIPMSQRDIEDWLVQSRSPLLHIPSEEISDAERLGSVLLRHPLRHAGFDAADLAIIRAMQKREQQAEETMVAEWKRRTCLAPRGDLTAYDANAIVGDFIASRPQSTAHWTDVMNQLSADLSAAGRERLHTILTTIPASMYSPLNLPAIAERDPVLFLQMFVDPVCNPPGESIRAHTTAP